MLNHGIFRVIDKDGFILMSSKRESKMHGLSILIDEDKI